MAIYYVRPDGNNTFAGTGPLASQAWATITKAAQTMVAGDTVWIAPGVYRETVEPSTPGTSGNTIKFFGDPNCQYFTDMTPGPVQIKPFDVAGAPGLDSYAFKATTAGRIYYDLQDLALSMATFGINCLTYLTITRCRVHGTYAGISTTGVAGLVFTDSVISGGEIGVLYSGSGVASMLRCVVWGGNIAVDGGGSTLTLTFCLIRNGVSKSSGTLNAYGCMLSGGHNNITPSCIYTGAAVTMTLKGCSFEKASRGLNDSPGTGANLTVQGCFFQHLATGLLRNSTTIAPTISYCQFYKCQKGTYTAMSTTLGSCGFDEVDVAVNGSGTLTVTSCLGHAVTKSASSGVTLSGSLTYGAFTPKAGNAITTTSPIAGTKSLRMAGYDYTPVFVQQVACEKGKVKPVKVKVKLTSASDSVTITLGDQTATTTATTNVQTLTLTYTHYDTEYLPLFICATPVTTNQVLIDDIAA